ncbi:kinase-like domain-containing protein [Rhodocollybia butyracea]|uniref:Kinase-like domain-containing protein n=1 Tax=Rhodocollybia butyracea TaxID=206335 RepID=A0A9P5PK91_9AGAR|nr:kinase-like domain-containing protein [Rhodocollybia butyracea]
MVAKRFFNVGAGPDTVDVSRNKQELESEAIRLAQTGYFYKCFQEVAEDRGVEIELKVTTFLLVQEIVGAETNPSPASGVTSYELQHEEDNTPDYHGVAWLLEPRRQKQFKKWTGTSEHPSYNNNMVGNILTCFAHFVYLHSKQTIVMADMQSISFSPSSQLEPLASAANMKSGAGDHGQEGIDNYVKVHTCVDRCESMRFEALDLVGDK